MGSARDFDFFMGSWTVRNRFLADRLQGSDDWVEFEATSAARLLPGVLGNEDEFRTSFQGGFVGMSFRFFDPASGRWSIYWADSRRPGRLDPPVLGGFENGTGVFEGTDVLARNPIAVRFTWTQVDTPSPRWEQAFSGDGGDTWEPNWIMEFTRAAG